MIAAPTDPKLLAAHVKKEAKAKRIILDLVKDHFLPHIVDMFGITSSLISSKNMFDTLVGVFQSTCVSR